MSLDLEHGDEEAAEELTAREKRRRERQGSTGSSSNRSSSRAESRGDTDLTGRLNDAFDRIAEQLEAREDEELATIIREDGRKMSAGLVSLTRAVTFLRYPLVVALSFIEPVLAFGRVIRVLFRRFMERRQRRWEEAQQEVETPQEYVPGHAAPVEVP